ncbi:Ecdysteroid kinase-domain-containing protein [Stachybotrys elegans]|uniref:Ecdysteroid kinase-domain-containing protein n=1 Tax=Stachybotrys elegans TaxID=80388 RepID=A0A8K0SD49_9HYPO|nr:Ecdysteroid kinase-domain-containing protein [Stachybotrys elegans]
MAVPVDPQRVADIMTSWLGLEVVSCEEEQQLWAGYGYICSVVAKVSPTGAVAAEDLKADFVESSRGPQLHLILKLISPPPSSDGDEGHIRKLLSYEVEQKFYVDVAPRLKEDVAVATCIASTQDMEGKPNAEELRGLTATLMTDLRPKFPVAGEKRAELTQTQVQAALEWLAKFHADTSPLVSPSLNRFVLPPLEEMKRRQSQAEQAGDYLWLNGGYTYLATRRDQYASLSRRTTSEWCAAFCKPTEGLKAPAAEMAASFLMPQGRAWETLIHGDVKSENLFSNQSGNQVAFFDFQYVGIGLGVCDLAKLFTCSVPLALLTGGKPVRREQAMSEGEKSLLMQYRSILLERAPQLGFAYPWDTLVRHWETALVDWCRFQASWGFWGNTNWLQARVRSILKDPEWKAWVQAEVASS